MDEPLRLGGGLTPIPASVPFLRSPARFCCAVTGRRGTKTYTGARKFATRIYQDIGRLQALEETALASKARGEPHDTLHIYRPGNALPGTSSYSRRRPRAHYWVVAETYDLLDESRRALSLAIPPELVEGHNSGRNYSWLWPDVLIEYKTAHDPKRLVARGLNGVWMEEASRIKSAAWRENLRPTLSDKLGWALVTTTPMGLDWVYDDFVLPARRGETGYAFYTWRTSDNPHIPATEIALARRTMHPAFFRREYEASFEAFQGQVYDEWSPAGEFDELPIAVQFRRILAGADWGFANPGAEVVIGITHDDHVYVLDEVYGASLLVEDFWAPQAKGLEARWRFSEWVADPAEPDQLTRFRRAGIQVSGHRNYGSGQFDEHSRSVLSGIRLVASLIHQGRLHIDRQRCPNVLRELKNYRWDETPRGDMLEQPLPHQSDHAITAMRYAISWALKGPSLRAA